MKKNNKEIKNNDKKTFRNNSYLKVYTFYLIQWNPFRYYISFMVIDVCTSRWHKFLILQLKFKLC